MNLYELIAKHGKGKGEQTMWKTVKTVSDYIERNMDELEEEELYKKVYEDMCGCHYDKELATDAISKMYYVHNGAKHAAPYWGEDKMHQVYGNVMHLIPDNYTEYDFWVALNMLKSDYAQLLESWFGNDADNKVIEMAVTYFNDPDAKHKDTKIWHYMM